MNSLSLGNAILLSGLLKRRVELPLNGDLYWKQLQKLVKKSKFVKSAVRKDVKDDITKSFK